MFGMRASATGATANPLCDRSSFPPNLADAKTIAETFRDAGRVTAAVGKVLVVKVRGQVGGARWTPVRY